MFSYCSLYPQTSFTAREIFTTFYSKHLTCFYTARNFVKHSNLPDVHLLIDDELLPLHTTNSDY